MAWGCKPENYPDGCGWSQRLIYQRLGLVEWWCDTCERAGDCLAIRAGGSDDAAECQTQLH
jgi:hypothetical protein